LGWLNSHLATRDLPPVKSISQGLRDGTVFIELVEILSGEKLSRYGSDRNEGSSWFQMALEASMQNIVQVFRVLTQLTVRAIPVAGIGRERHTHSTLTALDIIRGDTEATEKLLYYIFEHLDRDNYLKSRIFFFTYFLIFFLIFLFVFSESG